MTNPNPAHAEPVPVLPPDTEDERDILQTTVTPNPAVPRTPLHALGLLGNVWPAHWLAGAESLSLVR